MQSLLKRKRPPGAWKQKSLQFVLLEHELMKAMDHIQTGVLVATSEVVPELLRGGNGLVGLVDERVEQLQVRVCPNLGPPALLMGALPLQICNN